MQHNSVHADSVTTFKFKPHSIPKKVSTVDRKIIEVMNKHKVVGLTAAVIKDQKLIWSNGYGLGNLSNSFQVNRQTVFRVASISKIVAATALMQQYEHSKFELDDDIGTYLGYEIRNQHYPNEKITFRQLLTHTSSLVSDEINDSAYTSFSMLSQKIPPPSLKELIVPGGELYDKSIWGSHCPGDPKHFGYSNLGAIIVGTLVEVLSGQRFDLYCKEHIFRPLGMNHSDFNIEHIPNMENLATLYEYLPDQDKFLTSADDPQRARSKKINYNDYEPGTNGSLFGPQGGLRTNIEDLSVLMLAYMNGGHYHGSRILKEKTVDRMLETQWKGFGLDGLFKEMGLQFHITDDLIHSKKVIGHSGDAYGLLSAMYFNREERFGIVLITNGSDHNPGKRSQFYSVEESLADILYSKVCK